MLLFAIQRGDALELRPNWETDPGFGEALRRAAEGGVVVAAHLCRVSLDGVTLTRSVPVRLD